MDDVNQTLSEETARAVLNQVVPDSELVSVTVAPGSFSNYTHILTVRLRDGHMDKMVIRRYKVFGSYDRGEKACREFRTFELLNRHKVPAPAVLYLDETGEVMEMPGIVTRFVEGNLVLEAPADPLDWAGKLAGTLATIHAIPCGEDAQKFLLKGNSEATWFLNSESPPGYIQAYPGGEEVWQILKNSFPTIERTPPVLLHLDYWSGNILWRENEISAVIDWEEAACGDPAVDVGYAFMNIVLMGLPEAADEFLRVYEAQTGRVLRNLGFWQLAAAVRPMTDPDDWKINQSPGKDVFQAFIEAAKKRL